MSKHRTLVGITLALAGVALITLGAALGEPAVVLRKTIYICLECMGIG